MTADMYARFGQALGELEPLIKDAQADTGKYVMRFADLNQILRMIKPVLARYDMAISQPVEFVDGHIQVTTLIIDIENGDRLAFPGPACPTKADPQAVGSTITYFRRYGLVSLFSLEAEDDDGGKAHRQATDPENRTAAETDTRRIIKAMNKDDRASFINDFKAQFGTGLTDLPESQHGDALTFTKAWSNQPQPETGEPSNG